MAFASSEDIESAKARWVEEMKVCQAEWPDSMIEGYRVKRENAMSSNSYEPACISE